MWNGCLSTPGVGSQVTQKECWCCPHWGLRACVVHLWRNGKILLFGDWSRLLSWLLGQDPEVFIPSPIRWKRVSKRGFFLQQKGGVKVWQSVTESPAKTDTSLFPPEFRVFSTISSCYLQIGRPTVMAAWEQGFMGHGPFSAQTGVFPPNVLTELPEQGNHVFQAKKKYEMCK